jgi:hypothetical protein
MGKALGGGLPLSGTMYREELDTWEPGGHTGTFRGYVPAMRAAVRTIEYIEAHDLLAHARQVGAHILERLRDELGSSHAIGDSRGRGLFVGVELVDGGEPARTCSRPFGPTVTGTGCWSGPAAATITSPPAPAAGDDGSTGGHRPRRPRRRGRAGNVARPNIPGFDIAAYDLRVRWRTAVAGRNDKRWQSSTGIYSSS